MQTMHFVLGEGRGNSADAVRQYAKKYPDCQIPNYRTFVMINKFVYQELDIE
jgi:hypothetical protein